jgi:hypothetical protein
MFLRKKKRSKLQIKKEFMGPYVLLALCCGTNYLTGDVFEQVI